MSIKYVVPSFALLLLACGAPATDEGTLADESLGASPIAAGYYVLSGEDGAVDRWIESVNLHADGSYDADFGDDVSNLSGLNYLADGTYAIDTKASTISFSQAGGTSDPYSYRIENGVLELKFVGQALEPQNWFSLAKKAAPVTLTFAADWITSQSGPLEPGATVLVRYAASRAHCTGAGAVTSLEYVIDGGTVGNEFFGEAFPSAPVHGYVDVLLTVPAGHDLAFYFPSESNGCTGTDSDFGKNYHFTIE